jgi:streptogramin lyase
MPATVATIAGSGAPGFSDGPALQAEFIFPTAVATDAAGNLYVADAGAQRIRVIGRDRLVRTLAGSGHAVDHGLWVPGGYRDGPGDQALFNVPSGIAIGPDGMVYVADTYNGRVRRIAHDGTVSTFATLSLPVALVFDGAGNLYVADQRLGLQRISRGGAIQPLNFTTGPFGFGLCERGQAAPVMVASDPHGLVYSIGGDVARLPGEAQAGDPFGTPFQLAMPDCESVVFSDARTHTLRYLHELPSVILAGARGEDSYDDGGFRDGPSTTALFDVPFGVTATADGSLLVADAGNRRIRRIVGFDRRRPIEYIAQPSPSVTPVATSPPRSAVHSGGESVFGRAIARAFRPTARYATLHDRVAIADPSDAEMTAVAANPTAPPSVPLPPPRDGSGDYRILYLGNSVIWWRTVWSDSIMGVAESTIDGSLAPRARRVRIVPVRFLGASLDGLVSYLDEVSDTGLVDAVVLHLNDGTVAEGPQAVWVPPAIAALKRASSVLAASHVPLLVVVNPIPSELGPTENTWAKFLNGALPPQYLDREEGWRTVLASAGAPYADLWPAFIEELRSPQHRPIFSTDDAHLTAHGRALVGRAVGAELVRLHPWSTP